MKEGLGFSYAGINSADKGLISVTVGTSGMLEEQFISDREIVEVAIRGREKPYFQQIKRSPMVLSLSFAFEDSYDETKIRDVARWLDQAYYQPFYTDDNPSRIFYCMLDSSSALLHNGLKQGYVTLQMRCDSPYSYSPVYTTSDYIINGSGTISFNNDGDVNCYPEVWITKSSVAGDISIVNVTNAGKDFKFTGISNTEIVYVDSENQHIESSFPDTYRYDNFNDNYLETVRGINTLNVTVTAMATVTVSTVNIYTAPNTGSSVIGPLIQNDRVKTISTTAGWTKVDVGQTGYVESSAIIIDAGATIQLRYVFKTLQG